MCYAITQSSCLDDYRSAKYGWSVLNGRVLKKYLRSTQ
jgi:hypothetical protein